LAIPCGICDGLQVDQELKADGTRLWVRILLSVSARTQKYWDLRLKFFTGELVILLRHRVLLLMRSLAKQDYQRVTGHYPFEAIFLTSVSPWATTRPLTQCGAGNAVGMLDCTWLLMICFQALSEAKARAVECGPE